MARFGVPDLFRGTGHRKEFQQIVRVLAEKQHDTRWSEEALLVGSKQVGALPWRTYPAGRRSSSSTICSDSRGADSLSVGAVQERMGSMKITTFAAVYIGSYESQS